MEYKKNYSSVKQCADVQERKRKDNFLNENTNISICSLKTILHLIQLNCRSLISKESNDAFVSNFCSTFWPTRRYKRKLKVGFKFAKESKISGTENFYQ